MTTEEKNKTVTLWNHSETWNNGKTVKHDKVYFVHLIQTQEETPSSRNNSGQIIRGRCSRWQVICKWGRRGGKMSEQIKRDNVDFYTAAYEFDMWVRAKQEKGYEETEFVTEIEFMHEVWNYDE